MGHFQNAVVIVTGGASGIGRALSEELGRRGAVVAVTDVDETGAPGLAGFLGLKTIRDFRRTRGKGLEKAS